MLDFLTRDISKTIEFLEEECTADQLIWMSELFDEIVEKTKNRKFIDALYHVAEKYPSETEKYNIKYFIDSATDYLE